MLQQQQQQHKKSSRLSMAPTTIHNPCVYKHGLTRLATGERHNGGEKSDLLLLLAKLPFKRKREEEEEEEEGAVVFLRAGQKHPYRRKMTVAVRVASLRKYVPTTSFPTTNYIETQTQSTHRNK
jgi:hypothetical protein